MGAKFDNVTPTTNRSQKINNFSWIFFPNSPHKTTLGIFEILNFWFLTIFFSRNQKPQLSGKRAIVESTNGVKFGTHR